MTYYQLNINQNIISPQDFLYVGSNELKDNILISKTLHDYLNTTKTEIDMHYERWDIIKKYTNPYEYIHSQIPNSKISVSKYKPLSRSYFKFIEMANTFSLMDCSSKEETLNSFHLAEGPGGFIEAMVNLRKNSEDTYYGMTLLNSDVNVPGWHKSQHFLSKNQNVTIERGSSGDGDLLNPDNLRYVHDKYKNSMEIVTGDGGFDFSIDFNQQESMSAKLLFAQICYALIMQKRGGHFVLKFFDTFSRASVEMLYILNMFYENVNIVKPYTSRYANSERYVVCKKFKPASTTQYLSTFTSILKNMRSNCYVSSLLKEQIPYYFIIKIEEINAILGQQQLETIVYTLSLIQTNSSSIDNKIEQLISSNVNKCSKWCLKNNINYNKMISLKNSFMDNTSIRSEHFFGK
jgi:23S rRNA U2552 (ribose-2'-O)-methylase RlmE/FtsJ